MSGRSVDGWSFRQLTSAGGTVTGAYEYNASATRSLSGTTPNNYLYRGEPFDSDLGMYYLRARWYNPQTGRFLSQDPAPGFAPFPQTLHKYLYAGADPENYIDPTGRDLADEEISLEPELQSQKSLEYVGERVSCLLNTTAAVLDAIQATDALGLAGSLTNLAYSFESCSGEAEGEIKEPQQCPLCFAAGTPVHTDHGDVPVQDIKVGDEVLSENSKTGKTEYQPVTALTHPHLDQLLEIRIEGEAEPLRPSTGHPFWARSAQSDAARWMKAGDLPAGEFLETPTGGWRRVVQLQLPANKWSPILLSTKTTTTSSAKPGSWFTTQGTPTVDQAIFNMSSSMRLSSECRAIGTIKMPRCLNKLLKAL